MSPDTMRLIASISASIRACTSGEITSRRTAMSEQRHALLGTAPRNAEEIAAIRHGKPAITLGNVRRDRERGAV
jgi:hypothetical protein